MKRIFIAAFLLFQYLGLTAQDIRNNPGSNHGNRFEELGTILPTPNEYRTASGAPGPKYWQQRADYDITCELDEDNRRLFGSEVITYINNSPDVLTYLWLQLDENQHSPTNNAGYQTSNYTPKSISVADAERMNANAKPEITHGHNITKVETDKGVPLAYTINKTMMRVDLPQPLKPGQKFKFRVEWNYYLVDRMRSGGRGGYEHFPEDGNDLFTITQWFPRLCVYSDNRGWQTHQFTGRGEFALTFGNYKVKMTVPADHVVMATGEGQNYKEVLSPIEYKRWQQAQNATDVVEIVTLEEAVAKEKTRSKEKKTWIFKADMVRDFAWGSSRKFIWDAKPTYIEGKKIMCMSAYGKEAYHLYRRFSTKVVEHTLKVYSHFTIPYPYPVAQSIEASNGMEYPMICFNFGRTEKDGTYTEATKNGMIGVIIHEVGHNFFPMIINSDERQWSWMDEGMNTFCEYLAEEMWDNKFPVSRGPAYKIVNYMKLPKDQLEPIMTNSENIIHFGPNAYAKPATGLNILRETIMGRELFDFSFKEFSRRWAFKHPTPADFFRTMEDASGEDLDWFWRGWFYNTDPCDLSLDSVKHYTVDLIDNTPAPVTRTMIDKVAKPILNDFDDISKVRNRQDPNIVFATDADTSLRDFYWHYARGLVKVDTTAIERTITSGNDIVTAAEAQKIAGNIHYYELYISNKGGLVMPVIIEWTFEDGSKDITRISAHVWRKNEHNITKTFQFNKKVTGIKLDPMRETADIDEENNVWPQVEMESKFQLFKNRAQGRAPRGASTGGNPMQQAIQ
jgi:hypothetical protein